MRKSKARGFSSQGGNRLGETEVSSGCNLCKIRRGVLD